MNPSSTPTERPPTSSLPKIAIGALGGALIGAARRDGRGRAARVAGFALVGLAARRIVEEMIRDIGARRGQVVTRSSIDVERSVGDVFAFLNDFENLPRVFGNLHSVIDYQDGRAHWEAYTPAGRLVQWDTVITKYLPRSVIAWESTPESEVHMTALIRFTALAPTRTRVDLETTYRPPPIGVRDAVRALLGPAQEKQFQMDLAHARYYVESLAPQAAVDVEAAAEAANEVEAAAGAAKDVEAAAGATKNVDAVKVTSDKGSPT